MANFVDHKLFERHDELEFKKFFVIQFLASKEAQEYTANCQNGWEGHAQDLDYLVDEARSLADQAWEAWDRTIGFYKRKRAT